MVGILRRIRRTFERAFLDGELCTTVIGASISTEYKVRIGRRIFARPHAVQPVHRPCAFAKESSRTVPSYTPHTVHTHTEVSVLNWQCSGIYSSNLICFSDGRL